MKILIFSDSHGHISPMLHAVEREQPHQLIHLGDLLTDGTALAEAYPLLPFHCVPGNCDGVFNQGAPEVTCSLAGTLFLLMHGHTHNVKADLRSAVLRANTLGAKVLLFGHTHIPHCQMSDGLWQFNPGAVQDGCYGVITLDDDTIACQLKHL